MPMPIGRARGPREHDQRPHAHTQSGAGNSTRSANASVTPNLPIRSAVSRMRGAKKAQRLNGHVGHTCTCAGPREQLEEVYKQTRMRKNTQRRLYNIKLTWYKSRTRPEEPQSPEDHANASGMCTGTHSYQFDMKTAARTRKDVSIPQNKTEWPNSPNGTETQCRDEADSWVEPRGWVDGARRHAER